MSGIGMSASLFRTDGPTEFTALADGSVTLPANLGGYSESLQLMLHFLLSATLRPQRNPAKLPAARKRASIGFPWQRLSGAAAVGIVLKNRWAFH